MRPRSTAQSGMTLIEVMVAIAIFGIISGLLYAGFVQTSNNKKRVERQLDRAHEIRMGLERIAKELSMAYTSAQLNPNPVLQPMKTCFIAKERGSSTRLDFTSFSHIRLYRDANESDQNELSYFVTEHPEDNSRDVLARREQQRLDDKPEEGGQIQILVDDVESFEVQFLDPLSGEWVKSWDTTQAAMQPNRLPSQAKILLTVPNLKGRGADQVFSTRAIIPLRYALNHAIYNP